MRAQHLQVLGLGANPTDKQIKSAYRTLSKKYHPDINDTPQAKEQFLSIKEAYEYLTNTPDYLVEPKPYEDEEVLRARWRADAQRRARAKERENQQKLDALVISIVKHFRAAALLILLMNVLLTVDYFIPLKNHDQSILSINRVYEHSSASRYAGKGHYRYDEIIFDDYRMTFDKRALIELDHYDRAIVSATPIFGTPMSTTITIDGIINQFMPIFNIYFIFGYLIPVMLLLSGLFFWQVNPMSRLNIAIVLFVFSLVQLMVFFW